MKYQVNASIDFMDGTHADAGQTVDVDPAKVTDLADLEQTMIGGVPAIVRMDEPPAPQKSARAEKVTAQTPPTTEVTTNG